MKSTLLPFAAALVLLASASQADCIYPKAPEKVPDGKNATEEEMVDGMKALKQFDADVNAYTSCLEMETNTRVQEASPPLSSDQVNQLRAIQVKKQNAAVDELQTMAQRFNEQVRAFKARQKG